jgi:putative endonuclease
MMKRKETGDQGEDKATQFLRQQGYRIIERNYRCPRGEIDIVAREKDCLVFVEVRSKTQAAFGAPEESLTPAKQKRMLVTAFWYLEQHRAQDSAWRIELVAIETDSTGKTTRLELIPCDFSAEG